MNTIKNKLNKGKDSIKNKNNERKVKNEEKIRERTSIYRFRIIKKMKKLYDLCLDETYDIDLRETYLLTLNNILIKKIIGINTSIDVEFRFTLNKEEENNQFVDTFVVFVRNTINCYNLHELKLIDHIVTKFLK